MPAQIKIADMPLSQVEEKFGVKARMGILSRAGKEYKFKVDAKTWTFDESVIISAKPIGKLIGNGTQAGGIIIDGVVVAIVLIHFKVPIICYISPPGILNRVNFAARIAIIDGMIKEKVLPSALGNALKEEMQAR